MEKLENNEKAPAELPLKDRQALKQDYDLLEFSINTAEEFKKAVRKTKGACAEFFRRILITYNLCQVAAEQRIEAFPNHNLFVEILQKRYQEEEEKIQHIKAVRKTKGACTEFFRRLLITYNRCQVEAEQRIDAFPDHNLFVEILQKRYQEEEKKYSTLKLSTTRP